MFSGSIACQKMEYEMLYESLHSTDYDYHGYTYLIMTWLSYTGVRSRLGIWQTIRNYDVWTPNLEYWIRTEATAV